MMRKFAVCVAIQIAFLASIGYGQTGAEVEPPKDAQALIKAVAPHYDFNSDNLKPWHLNATYQFYDAKGNPTEQGKWEFWWSSPKVHRSTWTRNHITQSEWSNADGIFRKQDGGSLRYFERNISSILLIAPPSEKIIDSKRVKLEYKMTPVGQVQLACVSATLQLENNGKLQVSSSIRPEIYCFDPSTLILQSVYNNSFIYEYNQLMKAQNLYLAKNAVVMIGDQKLFSIAIDTIDGITPEDPALVRPTDAVLISEPIRENGDTKNESVVMVGSPVKRTPPVYPVLAKVARIQGTVVLAAVIGKDGKIHDLETLVSPSKLLAKSAEDAVEKWEYKPYLLNGNPVEVETIVNVTFALGH